METTQRVFFNQWFFAMVLLGGTALGASLLAVEVFGLKPCVMCKLQRIPFALLIMNGGFGLFSSYKQGFFQVLQVCLALGVILGLGHFLMQMGALPDPCATQNGFKSPEEFSKVLLSPKCSMVNWSFFGIPVSLLNALLHGFFLFFSSTLTSMKGR